jgi:hypothetical protein
MEFDQRASFGMEEVEGQGREGCLPATTPWLTIPDHYFLTLRNFHLTASSYLFNIMLYDIVMVPCNMSMCILFLFQA